MSAVRSLSCPRGGGGPPPSRRLLPSAGGWGTGRERFSLPPGDVFCVGKTPASCGTGALRAEPSPRPRPFLSPSPSPSPPHSATDVPRRAAALHGGGACASGPWEPMGACGGGGGGGRPALPLSLCARGGGGGGMSVAFVPERLRGKAEVNQETLQQVSAAVAVAARALPARLR